MDQDLKTPLLKQHTDDADLNNDDDDDDNYHDCDHLSIFSSGRATPPHHHHHLHNNHHAINSAGLPPGHSPPVVSYDTFSKMAATNIQTPEDEIVARDGTTSPRGQGGERGENEEFRVYTRRWYILALYCLVSATQGGVWNTFGPIAATTEDAFGWTDSTIALLSNWGPIAYLIAGILFSWMMDVKGMRLACLVTVLVVAVGTALRCITFNTPAVTGLMHVGQFLNGLGGPVAMAMPPILSAVWFPAKQRTTATAIGTVWNFLGVAFSFILGPLLIPDVPANATKATTFSFNSENIPFELDHSNYSSDLYSHHNETAAERIHKEKKAIAFYMYIEAGWSAAILLLVLLYFPSKPPVPPSPSAAIPREDFLQGLKHLMTRRQFWLVGSIYGISLGTLSCWTSVLDVILKPHGIDEIEAGWIGFYATCSSCVASLIVARFADFFSRIMKWLILCSYTIGTAAFVVFALATIRIVPPSTALFYTTIIAGSTALNAAVPLIFELACEVSYPTGEGTTNGVLTILSNISGLIFLLLMMIPGIGSAWTNWMVVGTAGCCLPLLFFMKERYNRLEIDEHNPSLTHEVIVPDPVPSVTLVQCTE